MVAPLTASTDPQPVVPSRLDSDSTRLTLVHRDSLKGITVAPVVSSPSPPPAPLGIPPSDPRRATLHLALGLESPPSGAPIVPLTRPRASDTPLTPRRAHSDPCRRSTSSPTRVGPPPSWCTPATRAALTRAAEPRAHCFARTPARRRHRRVPTDLTRSAPPLLAFPPPAECPSHPVSMAARTPSPAPRGRTDENIFLFVPNLIGPSLPSPPSLFLLPVQHPDPRDPTLTRQATRASSSAPSP